MSFRGILSAAILVFSEGLILRGPSSPLVAQPGGVLQLPCSVETPLPLDELEVEWRRTDSKELVHLFQEGQSRPESQSDAYRDRAHFFTAREIAEGNYSLLLRNVTTHDVGTYSCSVYRKEETGEIAVEIEIERLVLTGADHAVSAYAGEEVILNCFVDSHIPPEEVSWFKVVSDESHMLVLLFQDNETSPGDSSYQGRAEFFTSEISKGNFSLRLNDVRTEDKGEYICKAFSGLLSANTTVILQELGLSSMHQWVFALCCFAFIVALVSAMILLCIKDISQRAFIMHYVLVFGPSVLMFTAFVLWGVIEGFMTEVVTCSALNLSRFILLFKTSPYQERLPGMIKTIIKTSFEFEYIIVLSILYYVIYNVWSAEVNNKGMAIIGGVYGLSSLLMGVMIFLRGRASILMGLFIDIVDFLYFLILIFLSRTFSLSAVISMLAGIYVVFQFWIFFRFLWKSALIQLGWLALRRVIISVVVFYCVSTSFLVRKEERAGLLSVTVLLHLLALSEGLDCIQPSLAETPKTILYMYGAFGVLGVNAITLATELILKSRKGYRTVTDLRVILLPFEWVFVLIWIALWFHAHWTERCIQIKEEVAIFRRYGCRRWLKFLKNGAKRSEALEMLSQSAPPPAGSDTPQESPQEAPPEAETEIHSIGNVPEDIDTNSPGLVGKNDSHFPDTNPERAEEDCKVGANADTNRHTTGSHINAHLCETITSENDSLLDHTQSVVQINLTKPRDSSAQESFPLLGKDIVESVPPSESE